MFNTWFDKLEDWFLELSFVNGKWPEKLYFSLCRLFNKVKDVLWYGPRNFIKNIYIFREILWSDRWFDYYYFLNMIRVKLEHDAKMHRKYGICVNNFETADQMEYCIKILKKVIDDDYDLEHLKSHDEKWGEYSWSFTKANNGSILNMKRPNVKTDEDAEQESKEFVKHVNNAAAEKEGDINHLFETIAKNLQSWWD